MSVGLPSAVVPEISGVIMYSSSRLIKGGADDGFCVFQRGWFVVGCLTVRGAFTVTGDENRLKFVGLITPDIPPTVPILG